MVQAAENGNLHDEPVGSRARGRRVWDLLADALVWPRLIEVGAVVSEPRPEVPFAQDEHVVEALGTHAAQERPWGSSWRIRWSTTPTFGSLALEPPLVGLPAVANLPGQRPASRRSSTRDTLAP